MQKPTTWFGINIGSNRTEAELTKARNERNKLRKARSAQVQRNQTSGESKRANGNFLTHLEVDSEATTDRNKWEEALSRHATQKYTDPEETDDVKATRIVNLNLLSEMEDATTIVKMNIRGRMSKNKSPGGGSRITAEMLHLLPMSVVFVITFLFCERASRKRMEVNDLEYDYLIS